MFLWVKVHPPPKKKGNEEIKDQRNRYTNVLNLRV